MAVGMIPRHKLVPCVEIWVERKYEERNCHLMQFLTGHDGNRKYFHRSNESPECLECAVIPEDSEHLMFHCPRFNTNIGPRNLVKEVVRSGTIWITVNVTIVIIQKEL